MRGIKTQKPVLKKIQPVLGDFTPARYESRRLWATSPDGVKVPISVVYRKDKVNGAAPTVLEGYGAYEIWCVKGAFEFATCCSHLHRLSQYCPPQQRPLLLVQPAVPAGPRCHLRHCARARWRRDGPTLVG